MPRWVGVTEASKQFDTAPDTIYGARVLDCREWFAKHNGVWKVDIDHPEFTEFIKKKSGKSKGGKVANIKATRRRELESGKSDVMTLDDTRVLQEASIQADLAQPIVKLRLEKYKIEKSKLELEKQAGNLIPRQLAAYLYTGYLDRLNREMLQYRNKLEQQFELIIADVLVQSKGGGEVVPSDFAKKMTKLIKRETEETIRNVKKAQIAEVERWAEEEGISL